MCIIVVHKPGAKPLDVSDLRAAWSRNHDGAGMMWTDVSEGGQQELWYRKPIFKLTELEEAYASDQALHNVDSWFVLHLRTGTHGGNTKENTHPHLVGNGTVGVMHNGVLTSPPAIHNNISDTVWFCKTVLGMRDEWQLMSKRFARFLEDFVGYNKLVLLSRHNRIRIINEEMGEWKEDKWFSSPIYNYARASSGEWRKEYTSEPVKGSKYPAWTDAYGEDGAYESDDAEDYVWEKDEQGTYRRVLKKDVKAVAEVLQLVSQVSEKEEEKPILQSEEERWQAMCSRVDCM